MRYKVRIVVEVLALLVAVVLAVNQMRELNFAQSSPTSSNVFPIGAAATTAERVEVPVAAPIPFNDRTRSEIFALREARIDAVPPLRPKDYAPFEMVFSQMVDRKPWWGIRGLFCVGGSGDLTPVSDYCRPRTELNIEGPSRLSRVLLNPFLLVGIDSLDALTFKSELPGTYDGGAKIEENISPAYFGPKSLRWWPAESRGEATYDAGRLYTELLVIKN